MGAKWDNIVQSLHSKFVGSLLCSYRHSVIQLYMYFGNEKQLTGFVQHFPVRLKTKL